jgi:predicted nucleic acid-binding protein
LPPGAEWNRSLCSDSAIQSARRARSLDSGAICGWVEFGIVEVDPRIVSRAAELAHSCALRGYDAVHCACAEQLADADLVVASGDGALLEACTSLGLATAAINQ